MISNLLYTLHITHVFRWRNCVEEAQQSYPLCNSTTFCQSKERWNHAYKLQHEVITKSSCIKYETKSFIIFLLNISPGAKNAGYQVVLISELLINMF